MADGQNSTPRNLLELYSDEWMMQIPGIIGLFFGLLQRLLLRLLKRKISTGTKSPENLGEKIILVLLGYLYRSEILMKNSSTVDTYFRVYMMH